MEDRQEMTLEKYDFQVKNRYRARGAVLLDTNEGPLLLREQNRLTGHFTLENEIKEHLRQQGMIHLDFAVANREGELVTEWETGEKYVVYRWFRGEECDIRNPQDLRVMAENLGKLHRCLHNYYEEPVPLSEPLLVQYDRHNREMKRVYSYMKEKKRKTEFECYAMQRFGLFYDRAKRAGEQLEKSPYYRKHGVFTRDFCHGEYNYHNLLFSGQGLATTNFEHAAPGVQLMDLAYFMRKTMEKNRWQPEKGRIIWEGYRREAPCEGGELEFLATVLSYPIKYWKLLNQYINGKKTWISNKSIEKLKAVCEQEENKEKFLERMLSFEKNTGKEGENMIQ